MDSQVITRTIDSGQPIRLICSTIYGNDTGKVVQIQYNWTIGGTLESTEDEFVVTPTSNTDYKCNTQGVIGKHSTVMRSGTIRIIIRGNLLW